uniref:DUF148 domain-containing protein n=1 Tax=Strongyloides papillosus TaxID=174720 RepID=A0A0N5BR62_STREA
MKFFISFLCLLGFINFSYSLKASSDSVAEIIRDKLLNEMETKLDRMKKIQILKDKFKDVNPNMEMGNYTQYVLTKPFVELGIKKNLRDVRALVSQIEEKLLPYLTQDFDKSKRPKRSSNVAAQPGLDKAASEAFCRTWDKEKFKRCKSIDFPDRRKIIAIPYSRL